MAIGFILILTYLFSKFAQQEAVEDFYHAMVIDIEGRLSWAVTRPSCPFGMQANIETAKKLLQQAKNLWGNHQYHQAYHVARQSQKAIDKVQQIYISSIKNTNLNK